jgi:hypothetical protein
MNESNADPAFEAGRLTSAPGWYVRVASHAKCNHIPGFVSPGSEAMDRNKSAFLGVRTDTLIVQGRRRLGDPDK